MEWHEAILSEKNTWRPASIGPVAELKAVIATRIGEMTQVINQMQSKEYAKSVDIHGLALEYEKDMVQIITQAAQAVNNYKRQLEDDRDLSMVNQISEDYKLQHEAERHQAKSHLEKVREAAKAECEVLRLQAEEDCRKMQQHMDDLQNLLICCQSLLAEQEDRSRGLDAELALARQCMQKTQQRHEADQDTAARVQAGLEASSHADTEELHVMRCRMSGMQGELAAMREDRECAARQYKAHIGNVTEQLRLQEHQALQASASCRQLTMDIAALQQQISESNSAADDLRNAQTVLKEQYSRVVNQHEEAAQKLHKESASNKALQAAAQASQQKQEQLQQKVVLLEVELLRLQEEHSKRIASSQHDMLVMEGEVAAERCAHQEHTARLDLRHAALQDDLLLKRREIDGLERDALRIQAMLASGREEHAEQVADLQARLEKAQACTDALESAHASCRRDSAAQLEALQTVAQESNNKCDQLRRAAQEMAAVRSVQALEAQAQLKALRDEADAALCREAAVVKDLHAMSELRMAEAAQAQQGREILQRQLAEATRNAKAALHERQSAHAAALEAAVASAVADAELRAQTRMAAEMESMLAQHNAEWAKKASSDNAGWQRQVDCLAADSAAQLAAMQEAERTRQSCMEEKHRTAILQMQTTERAAAAKAVEQACEDAQRSAAQAATLHTAHLAALHEEHAVEVTAMRNAMSNMERETADKLLQAREEASRAARQHVEEINTVTDHGSAALMHAVQEYEARMAAQALQHDTESRHSQEAHAQAVASLRSALEEQAHMSAAMLTAKAEAENGLKDSQEACARLQELLRENTATNAALLAHLKAAAAKSMEDMEAAAAAHLAGVKQAHKADLALVQEQCHDLDNRAAAKYAALQEEHAVLTQRYHARESRSEDLAKVAELCESNQHQSKYIAQLKDHLQQLKGELLLREQSYNKTFANGGAGERILAVESALSAPQGVVNWMLKSSFDRRRVSQPNRKDSLTAKRMSDAA